MSLSRPSGNSIVAFANGVPERTNSHEVGVWRIKSHKWRRECQSILVDVQTVFPSNTREPTVLATSNWPIPFARCPQTSAPSSRDLDVAADGDGARKTMKRLIAANDIFKCRFEELGVGEG